MREFGRGTRWDGGGAEGDGVCGVWEAVVEGGEGCSGGVWAETGGLFDCGGERDRKFEGVVGVWRGRSPWFGVENLLVSKVVVMCVVLRRLTRSVAEIEGQKQQS